MKISFRHVPIWLGDRWRAQRGRSQRPADLEPIEGSVQSALHPVETPKGFRETLRANLQVAARQRQAGLRVEYPRPIRQILLVTLSLWVVVATVTTVLLFRHDQPRTQA